MRSSIQLRAGLTRNLDHRRRQPTQYSQPEEGRFRLTGSDT